MLIEIGALQLLLSLEKTQKHLSAKKKSATFCFSE